MEAQINTGDDVKINGTDYLIVQVHALGKHLRSELNGNGWSGMAIVRRKNGKALYNAMIVTHGGALFGKI